MEPGAAAALGVQAGAIGPEKLTDDNAEGNEDERAVTVRVGRIYDQATEHDGNRVLVDRLWPRGMSKARVDIVEWCKRIAPSTELRKWYSHDPQRFAEFRRRYRAELATGEPAAALAHLRELASDRALTLLTASTDPVISEAAVLAELLQERPQPHSSV
jgi:uncharacterized protein YeaO (DUF488 family)